MSGDKRDSEYYDDLFAGASEEPDDFRPDQPPDELVKDFSQARVDELGRPIVEIIRKLDGGLWKTAFRYAEGAQEQGIPADEIIYSILYGPFADFIAPGEHELPATKARLLTLWVRRYADLLQMGVDERKARRMLMEALKKAHTRDPDIDRHFAGLPPYRGEKGKPPSRSTVDRWTETYRN